MLKRTLSTILCFITILLAGCASSGPSKEDRILVDDFREDNTKSRSYIDLHISYPKNWEAYENSDDNALFFYLDNGTFTIYCREPGTEYTELNTQKRHIITDGYSEVSEIQYGEQIWEVRTYALHGTSQSIEGFLATTIYNGNKYFVFTYMDMLYDMNEDFQEIMRSIYFEVEAEPEETVAYQDSGFDISGSYPNVTIADIDSGAYEYDVVAIDAVIGHYEDTTPFYSWIEFDAWFNIDGTYECDKYKWTLFEDEFSDQFWSQVKTVDEGDLVRLYCFIERDNYFGSYSLKWIELLEKGTLEDHGIVYPIVEETDPTETTEATDSQEGRTVYITNSGSKYHTANCRWVSDSCIEISYADAIARGYTPCGTCNPRS